MRFFYLSLLFITFPLILCSCNQNNSSESSSVTTTHDDYPVFSEINISSEYDIPETEAPVTEENAIPDSYSIDIDYIYQNPELPTGCEVTSLTMLLNYLGFDVDKTELADDFLEKDYTCTFSFDEAFIGDPRWDEGYGCYAPVIEKTAQKYLAWQASSHTVKNISGTEFEDLYRYIADEKPVIVWCSMSLMDVNEYYCYRTEDGTNVYWFENEHCVLLTGYDKENETVTAADPLDGLMKYDSARFEYIFDQLNRQAIIIE